MTLYMSNNRAKALADDVGGAFDAGASNAVLKIYADDGTPTLPADADASLGTATLLANLDFQDPAFGAATDGAPGGLITANLPIEELVAIATGTAHFFRIVDSNALIICQGQCGTSGQELNLNTLSIVSGAKVEITSMTITAPESP